MTADPVVFVVEDDASFRRSLLFLLGSARLGAEGFETVPAFLASGRVDAVGCVLTDLRMPGASGHDLQAELHARQSPLGIVFMSAVAEVCDATRALRAGAVDFLEKPIEAERLLASVHEAIAYSQQKQRHIEARRSALLGWQRLTPREREVMLAVTSGYANKEIASELEISTRTVEVHRARVMEKMNVSSLPDLVRSAMLLREAEVSLPDPTPAGPRKPVPSPF